MKRIKCDKTFFFKPVIPQEICEIINSFDINISVGPNSIPVYILKIYKDFFSKNLCEIVNLSFITVIFPDSCKLAKIIPLHKKDDPLFCENYRPISLLPILSKIFEKLIYKRMYSFLEENKLIYNRQFGFRSNYSTEHALINNLTEYIKNLLDSGNIVCGVFIDLEKAFDSVNHEILCQKLIYYDFRGKSQLLIKSFLSNRKQCVSINGFNSDNQNITCGVPQGSNLGPLLFLLYINDFRFSLCQSNSNHFADDTCILFSSSKLKTIESILNYDLKCTSIWFRANRLSLNVSKSKLLIFHSKQKKIDYSKIYIKLNGSKLIPSSVVKYLGLYIDNNLSWDHNTFQLSKKLSRTNGILCKLRHLTPKSTLISIYYSQFYSYLTYGCSVWSLTYKRI